MTVDHLRNLFAAGIAAIFLVEYLACWYGGHQGGTVFGGLVLTCTAGWWLQPWRGGQHDMLAELRAL